MSSSGAPSSTPFSALRSPVGGASSLAGTGVTAPRRGAELEVEAVARKMFYGAAPRGSGWSTHLLWKLYFAEDCPPGVRKCKHISEVV